jgi:putative nucleotidyltransferase with HDIG domain
MNLPDGASARHESAARPGARSGSAPELREGRIRVALVDGDESVLRASSEGLKSAGFETSCFRTAEQALASLEAVAPAVVVSEYLLPGMDGVVFLKQARIVAPHAVRVLSTGAGEFGVALRAVNVGEVYRILPKPWHPEELVAIVRQAADAAQQRAAAERLVGRLRETNVELEALVKRRTLAVLESLVAALDYRDADTVSHSLRVSLFARRIARQMAMDEAATAVIEHAALLHDIGKIGVRDRVLHKPGPLSREERTEINRHPELGWALLQRVDWLKAASIIVLQHHETWDGTGYPNGLRAEEIEMGARVFHVVDSLDAITSHRTYRATRSFAEASKEIHRCRGTQFDPDVVDAFAAIDVREWGQIRAGAAH